MPFGLSTRVSAPRRSAVVATIALAFGLVSVVAPASPAVAAPSAVPSSAADAATAVRYAAQAHKPVRVNSLTSENTEVLANPGLDWHGDLPEPTVHGAVATYPNVLPGVDLVVETTVDAVHEVLVVKTPKAAANPALRSVELGVPLRNGTLTRETDGSHGKGAVVIEDGEGGTVFTPRGGYDWFKNVLR